jgi:hypothetical protein
MLSKPKETADFILDAVKVFAVWEGQTDL